MIQWLIDFSLRHRGVVLGVYLAAGAWGYWALRTANVDAIPDLSDQQVIVFTDWAGHSAQEVEDQVTYPLTTNLQGLAGVRVVRSQSAFGFSMIYVVFRDDIELYFARSRVLERLALAGKALPSGVVPTLGPDATGVGHVFWYTVESSSMSLRDLRSLQDWFIRYQLNTVPGVAEVASVGGQVQQYQVDIDANRLRGYGLTLSEVVAAVAGSNSNVGGNVVESSGTLVDRTRRRPPSRHGRPRERGDPGERRGARVRAGRRDGEDRGRLPRGLARQRDEGGGWRRHRRPLGRQRAASHRRRQGQARGDSSRIARGREHRAVLRPIGADRSRAGHVAQDAPPGDSARHARARRLPPAFPVDSDRHAAAAARRAAVVSRDAVRRRDLESHESGRHRDRDRRAGRRRHRRHRKRVPRDPTAGASIRPITGASAKRCVSRCVWWAGPCSSR